MAWVEFIKTKLRDESLKFMIFVIFGKFPGASNPS
jgi:hypothetical protein